MKNLIECILSGSPAVPTNTLGMGDVSPIDSGEVLVTDNPNSNQKSKRKKSKKKLIKHINEFLYKNHVKQNTVSMCTIDADRLQHIYSKSYTINNVTFIANADKYKGLTQIYSTTEFNDLAKKLEEFVTYFNSKNNITWELEFFLYAQDVGCWSVTNITKNNKCYGWLIWDDHDNNYMFKINTWNNVPNIYEINDIKKYIDKQL